MRIDREHGEREDLGPRAPRPLSTRTNAKMDPHARIALEALPAICRALGEEVPLFGLFPALDSRAGIAARRVMLASVAAARCWTHGAWQGASPGERSTAIGGDA